MIDVDDDSEVVEPLLAAPSASPLSQESRSEIEGSDGDEEPRNSSDIDKNATTPLLQIAKISKFGLCS